MKPDYLFILDEFLKIFKELEQRAYNPIQLQNEFYKRNQEFQKVWTNELTTEVIVKLKSDGYVRNYTDSYNETPLFKGDVKYYILTFEGLMFIENGGYEQREFKETQKITNQIAYNARMERYSSRLANWTEYLTYGTIGAAILIVAWGILTFFLERNHFH